MAEYFRPSAPKGRMKRIDLDDGLRAFRDQQGRIIDSLKLQQAKYSEYANEFIQGTKGVAQTEKENRRIIQNLETDWWKNRREAVKVKGQRHVESLLGKAEEYGKEAQFWSEFAPNFSKSLGSIASNIYETIDKNNAFNQFSEELKEGIDYQYTYGEGEALQEKYLNLALSDAAINKSFDSLDASLTPYVESRKHIGTLRASHLLTQKEVIITDLQNWAAKRGIPWNENTIPRIYEFRAREIGHHEGLRGNSKFKEFYGTMVAEGKLAAHYYKKGDEVNKGTVLQQSAYADVKANNSAFNRMKAVQTNHQRTRQGKGENSFYSHTLTAGINPVHTMIETMGDLADLPAYRDINKFIADAFSTPLDGAVYNATTHKWEITNKNGSTSPGTYADRYKNGGAEWVKEELTKVWRLKRDAATEEESKLQKTKAIAEKQKVEELVKTNNGKLYTNEEEWDKQIKQINKYATEYSGIDDANNPASVLRKALGLRPGSFSVDGIEADFVKAVKHDGDFLEAYRLWHNLSKEQAEAYGDIYKELQEFDELLKKEFGTATSKAGLDNLSKDILSQVLKWDNVGEKSPVTLKQMVPKYSQLLKSLFVKSMGEDKTIEQRWGDAKAEAMTYLYPNGDNTKVPLTTGLFATTEPTEVDGRREFKAALSLPSRTQTTNETDLRKSIIDNQGDLDKLIANTTILSEAALDRLAFNLTQEETVDLNNPELANIIDVSRFTNIQPSEVINKLLEAKDYKQRILPDVHEMANIKAATIQADTAGLTGLNQTFAVEYQYARQQDPNVLLHLMTPEVRDLYLQRLREYNVQLKERSKSDYGLRPVGGN